MHPADGGAFLPRLGPSPRVDLFDEHGQTPDVPGPGIRP